MNAAKLLRQKILDLAIRGKLTKREEGDEPAADLLARIAAEKQKLIAAKKIKKEKSLPPVTDDEKPFDLPRDWVWCRLGDIGNWKAGATPSRHHSEYYRNGKIPWLKTGDLNDGYVTSIPEFITKAGLDSTPAVVNPVGTVLMAMYGATIGKLGVLKLDAATNQACCACDLMGVVEGLYLFYFLLSQRERFRELGGGGAQPNISKDIIVRYPIPLPPLAEQKRIVSRVEELLAEVDKYSAAMDTLAASSEMMEKKVLDLAIRGKLTKRKKGDEPAAALLARIAAEKQKLIAAKKIKKEKPLTPITDDEKPFDLPKGWAWCRLCALGEFVGGHTPFLGNREFWDNGTVLWVTSKDMKCKYIEDTGNKVSKKGAAELQLLPPGTLLMVTRSGILRRTFPIAIAAKPLTINQDQRALKFHVKEISEYVYLALKALESKILKNYRKTGTTVESILWEKFIDIPIPLPPLSEQKRIVARVDKLLAECRKMRGV